MHLLPYDCGCSEPRAARPGRRRASRSQCIIECDAQSRAGAGHDCYVLIGHPAVECPVGFRVQKLVKAIKDDCYVIDYPAAVCLRGFEGSNECGWECLNLGSVVSV